MGCTSKIFQLIQFLLKKMLKFKYMCTGSTVRYKDKCDVHTKSMFREVQESILVCGHCGQNALYIWHHLRFIIPLIFIAGECIQIYIHKQAKIGFKMYGSI